MVLPTALFVFLAFDALRVALRRRTILMQYFWAIGRVASETPSAPSASDYSLLSLGLVGNPLNTFVREIWIFALRFNRAAIAQIDAEAEQLATKMRRPTGLTVQLIAREVRTVPEYESEVDLVAAC